MISHYFFVGLGGAIGSMARLGLSKILPPTIFHVPAQILLVNLIGCFLIGLLTGLLTFHFSITDNMRYFFIPGIFGGFTTFSSFALEVGLLVERNEPLLAILYVALSVGLSLLFFFAGLKMMRLFA